MGAPAEAAGSLRGRLLRRLLPSLLLVLVADAVLGHFLLRRPLLDAYDQALADSAIALIQHVHPRAPPALGLDFDLSAQAEEILRSDRVDEVSFLVLGPDGSLVAGDPLLPRPPEGAAGLVFYDGVRGGKSVRAVALAPRGGEERATVIVAETTRKREAAGWETALGVGLPQIVLGAVVLAVVWFGVRGGLASLERLREDLDRRSPRDLRPLDASGIVTEVRPLVEAFDGVLTRLDTASSAQNRFLANAAHQLRTPLAGLRAQLDLAIEEHDPQACHARMLQCREATARTTRLINQLLALSAAEPDGRRASPWQQTDLKDILAAHAQDWVERAIAQNVDLGFELEPAAVSCDALLIGEMASNLVDNALAYGRPDGQVTVRCGTADGKAFLEVEDDGPGIPESERERVLERFYRIPGTQGIGSGLGLAIVAEIARNHGGDLTLDRSARGGVLARVELPVARSGTLAQDRESRPQ